MNLLLGSIDATATRTCIYWNSGDEFWCAVIEISKSYLGNRTKAPLKLELIHTLVGWLSHLMTFVNLPLPATTSNPHPVDHIALLGLVA